MPSIGFSKMSSINHNQTQTTITKEQAQQWADALRSGKFKQTKGTLQDNLGHCCLGVACEIFIPKAEIKRDERGEIDGGYPEHQPNAPIWLKIINDDFYERAGGVWLSRLNDTEGYSFDDIAGIIELVYVHGALD